MYRNTIMHAFYWLGVYVYNVCNCLKQTLHLALCVKYGFERFILARNYEHLFSLN